MASDAAAMGPLAVSRSSFRRWLVRAVVASVVVGCLLVAMVVLSLRRTAKVETFEQPDGLSYADGQEHLATLWHVTGYGTPVGLGPDHYEVLLGTTDSYGHVVQLEASGFDPQDLEVEWKADGAWLNYGGGHRVFVPAAEFLYGR